MWTGLGGSAKLYIYISTAHPAATIRLPSIRRPFLDGVRGAGVGVVI